MTSLAPTPDSRDGDLAPDYLFKPRRNPWRDSALETLRAAATGYEVEIAECMANGEQAGAEFLAVGFAEVKEEIYRREKYGATSHPLSAEAPLESIKQLKDRAPIIEVITRLTGVEFVDRRSAFWTNCPFHSDSTPSLRANNDEQRWFCFSCRRGGDVLDFASIFSAAQSFTEAIRVVCLAANLDPGPYLMMPRKKLAPVSTFPTKTGVKPVSKPHSKFSEYRDGKVVSR